MSGNRHLSLVVQEHVFFLKGFVYLCFPVITRFRLDFGGQYVGACLENMFTNQSINPDDEILDEQLIIKHNTACTNASNYYY